MKFSIFPQATGGTELWTETQPAVALTQGLLDTTLGEGTAFPANLFDGTERYLEVSVGSPLVAMTPRMRLVSVPYAISAGTAATAATATTATSATTATTAQNVNGGTVNASSISVGGNQVIDGAGNLVGTAAYQGSNGVTVAGRTVGFVPGCAAGETLRWTASPTNAWQCAPYPVASDGGTLAYGVAAGQGLAVSGANNSLFGLQSCSAGQVLKSSGATWACASDSDTTYTATVNKGLILSGTGLGLDACPSGQIMKSQGSGNWACAADDSTAYDVIANGGLVRTGNNFGIGSCASGQIMKSQGSGLWSCQTDSDTGGTVTQILTSGGLSGGPITTTGTLSLAATVPNWTVASPAQCPAGSALRAIGNDGTPTCVSLSGGGTVVQVTAGTGIVTSPGAGITTTGTISVASTVQNWAAQPSCPGGQALQSISSAGAASCATLTGGGTVTSVASGSGLTGGPITGSGTLSVATGGVTNAMLANNGVTVSAGTGLSGGGAVALGGATTISLTTPVSASNGGTGITGPSAAGQFLRSSAAGAWSVATLSASDIPSLTATYVDLASNQTIGGTKTFSATIQGSISGNAATVTNGVVTSGTYADPAWITSLAGSKITGAIGGNAAGFTGSLGGDVTGTQGATTVVRIRGTTVSSTAPTANQLLAYSSGTSQWVPTSLSATSPVSVTGTNVGLIACASGQVLRHNGTSWACSSPMAGCTWAVDSSTANNPAREANCPASTSVVSGGCVGDGVATLVQSYARPEPTNGAAVTSTTSWLCSFSTPSTAYKAIALCCP